MDILQEELNTLLAILSLSHRLTPAECSKLQNVPPANRLLTSIAEQFRVDHDLDDVAHTLRLILNQNLLETSTYDDEARREELSILEQLRNFIPSCDQPPLHATALESRILRKQSTGETLTALREACLSPALSPILSFQSNCVALPFDDEVNEEIVNLLYRSSSYYDCFVSSPLSDQSNKASSAHSSPTTIPGQPDIIRATAEEQQQLLQLRQNLLFQRAHQPQGKTATMKKRKLEHIEDDDEEVAQPKIATKGKTTKVSSLSRPKLTKMPTKRPSSSQSDSTESTDSDSDLLPPNTFKRSLVAHEYLDHEEEVEEETPKSKFYSSKGTRNNMRDTEKRREKKKDEEALHYHSSTLLVVGLDQPARSNIAAFDMDSTLITTKSGRKFPTSRSDWQWLFPVVPSTLRQLYNQGYKVVIMTNQAGISKGIQRKEDIIGKIQDLSESAGIPIQAFIATSTDTWRKPNPGMWEALKEVSNGVELSLKDSFFVGDAAGRPARDKQPKDFSCDDRKFAHNIGLTFYTEREYFLKLLTKEAFSWDGANPQETISSSGSAEAVQQYLKKFSAYSRDTQEMILNIGPPASGKSTFTRRFLLSHPSYRWINQDTLKTFPNCISAAKTALQEGKSVVIDNTNSSIEKRAAWIEIAKQHNVPVRVLLFKTPLEVAHHLNRLRARNTKEAVPAVPNIAYQMFRKKYEEPTLAEGIQQITEVPFVPVFDTDSEQKSFLQF